MSEINLTQEFDASVWVDEWMKAIKNDRSIATSEGTMLGWFANAIMAGYDKARAERDEWKSEAIRMQLENSTMRWKDSTDGTMIDRRMLADINIALTQERDEWKQDAERLAATETDIYSEGDEEYIYCLHSGSCGSHTYRRRDAEFIHAPNCPITLHRELVEKYGG